MKLGIKGYYIPKTLLNEIEDDLTVVPETNFYIGDEFKLFKTTKHSIIIPRYYGIKKYGIPKKILFNPININIHFIGHLRNDQQKIIEICLKHIKKKGGGCLAVHCGGGKTTMALYIATKLKLKTLVVVHKTFLLEQWTTRCEEFTDATVGTIRQNKIDVKNKDIVIAMIQSIAKRNYGDIFNDFGLVIYDEAHHTPAKIFSKALQKTGSKYTLALSATPYRNDGLIKIMHWYIGDMIYHEKKQINNNVITCIFNYKPKVKEKKRFILGKIRPDTVKMITELIELKERNNFLTDIITTLSKNTNRYILVLSARKKHLKLLKNNCKINRKKYYYIGDMNSGERYEAEQLGDVLFGTYNMAQEALDIERLNTIILTTPQKDVVQAVGRILRKKSNINPLIIDIYDDLSVFIGQKYRRLKFYRSSQYVIHDFDLTKKNIKKLKKF